jgi:hypothetical protein
MTTTHDQNSAAALSIKTVLHTWAQQNKAVTSFFHKYEEGDYEQEVAPGRNKAIDLLGHLIVTNDGLLPLLGFGDRLYPELENLFVPNTEWVYPDAPALAVLQQKWEQLNAVLTGHFEALPADAWLERHTRVSEEDFAKDQMRNKLTVLLSRTIHMGYHLGQLAFLKVNATASL